MAKKTKVRPRPRIQPTTRTIEVPRDTAEERTYFIYRMVDCGGYKERKYIGSYEKKTNPGGITRFSVPIQGWTWKREAALKLGWKEDAANLIRLLDPMGDWKLKIEVETKVFEY